MDARQEARRLFEEEHLTPSQIAKQLGLPPGTVRGWKSKEQWQWNDHDRSGTPERSGGARACAREPKPGTDPFKPGNQIPTLHGLFARYLPEETRDIVKQIEDRGPIDVLWDQIQLAYAALIRAQKLMHVKDIDDMAKEIQAESSSSQGDSTSYQVQQAWDRHASFLSAQSRAQSALNGMLKQYDELCRSQQATEEQRARIDKLRSDMTINQKRLELDERKVNGDPDKLNTAAAQIQAIADLINNSSPDRRLDEFMTSKEAADDTICASDTETD